MKKYLIIIFILPILTFSCKQKTEKKELSEKVEPSVNLKEIETDFLKWWTYHSYNISFSSDFVSLNTDSDTIGKKQFLKKLNTGNYIPLRLHSNDKREIYKLFKLDSSANKNIRITIKEVSTTSLHYFEMEGIPFPDFDFIDLDDIHYTNENTKGKTIVLKTWFIKCKPCVAEFPELNKLVEEYKNQRRRDFLSLALDSKIELDKFLKKNNFGYKVIPNQEEFIKNKLKLYSYPTHVIIGKDGLIKKVTNHATKMISFLKNEKEASEKNIPPPPTPMK